MTFHAKKQTILRYYDEIDLIPERLFYMAGGIDEVLNAYQLKMKRAS